MSTDRQPYPKVERTVSRTREEAHKRRISVPWKARYSRPISVITVLGLIVTSFFGNLAIAQSSAPNENELQFVQRLLQYELVLGTQMTFDTGTCIDVQLGQRWRLPDNLEQAGDAWRKVSEKIRFSEEICLSSERNSDLRFVKNVRQAMENQLQRAAILQQFELARGCISNSADLTSLKYCVVQARGQELSDADWKRWIVLYQKSKNR